MADQHEKTGARLAEVARLFLRMGVTAFGGPAAHLAMMHDETVIRRKWLTDSQFLELVGATNLIPGPNSTEMAIHLGYLRAGWRGLLLAGFCFVVPAMLIVLLLAGLYARYGSVPQAQWLLDGVKPVIIAIILQALWMLGRKALKTPLAAAAAALVLAGCFAGGNEIALLFGAGAGVMLLRNIRRIQPAMFAAALPLAPVVSAAPAGVPFGLMRLFLTFLKIGSVMYGSGYVLLAFLRADFVVRYGWLTDQQMLDAIAIGQVTPGPLFTSATFIGYQMGGPPAALAATLGIFLPSFIFVGLFNPLIPRMRKSPWAASLLDGVNAASLGLMAAVTWQLGMSSLTDPASVMIALLAGLLLIRFRTSSTWLIAGGALIGFLRWISQV
ncbi:MAG TPA: chromate efflux transporter [Kiritimatiellia bacterium]|nr:chromate efflux transporter [Kiritimatiellia bacterium]HPA78362.1 chromate efflux transporter [Kiritimatiellia bacterium]HQQ03969.1 chromate efflux transporter [Kiritimatiellia bacterium]